MIKCWRPDDSVGPRYGRTVVERRIIGLMIERSAGEAGLGEAEMAAHVVVCLGHSFGGKPSEPFIEFVRQDDLECDVLIAG